MIRLLVKILGTSLSWRIGRALYLTARGEGFNDMETNGERLLVERIARVLSRRTPGAGSATIVDCGANLGDWTAMAKKAIEEAHTSAQFHLMEPSPATFQSVDKRFAGHQDTKLHPVALSDHDGKADFFLVSPMGGRNSLVDSEHKDAERITVAVARGTGYFSAQDVERITLLKIDTEGNDFAVLEGFGEMLANHQIEVVQFEYNFRWLAVKRSMREVFELAEHHGYRVGKADGESIYVYCDWNAELDRYFEWNYLLIAPDMIGPLGALEMRWSDSNTLIDAATP